MTKNNPAYSPHDITRIKAIRSLTAAEIENMNAVKEAGKDFFELVNAMGNSREISLAKTKIEEAVMWAVKGVTE